MDKTDDARGGGQVVHHEAIGGLERDGGEPMCADAILRLYSMTKPMTCVALMALYEQGHFQLLDPVSKFIPEFEGLKVAVEDGSDVALVDLDEPVTIRHLLTHTAGLTYGFWEYGAVEERYRAARVSADQPFSPTSRPARTGVSPGPRTASSRRRTRCCAAAMAWSRPPWTTCASAR